MLHGLVLDDGRRWGEAAVSWQAEDAEAILEPAPGSPTMHWIGRPKGGSKTTDLAGVAIAWLVGDAAPLVDGYAVAADHDQANRLLDRARGFVARTPGLGELVEVQARRILNRSSGARVHALEADVASSEGLLSPFVVVDELPNWPDTPTARRMWTSVVSMVPKWPGMTLVVIGHAGDPAHWSRAVLDVAIGRGWRVVEVPGPLEWVRPEDLAMQEHLLLPSEFARRHLNVWTSAEDRLTTVDAVRDCIRHVGPLAPVEGVRYTVGVDLGVKSDRTVATVAHVEREDDGATVVVDRMEVWTPRPGAPVDLEVVEGWLMEAHRSFGSPRVVCDPWQALAMIQRLRARGVRVEEFTFNQASIGRLALTLWSLLRDARLDLPDDEELVAELAAVQLRETSPGVYRMDHSSSGHDDRAVSLALAAWSLLERGRHGRRRSIVPAGTVPGRPAESFAGESAMRSFLSGPA